MEKVLEKILENYSKDRMSSDTGGCQVAAHSSSKMSDEVLRLWHCLH
jgi:hypothetical protein